MATTTIEQICDGIAATIAAAPLMESVQSFDELKEGINDKTPVAQVYPRSGNPDAHATNTERTTFKAGVRQAEVVIHIDVYGRQRANVGQDMRETVKALDSVLATLEAVKDSTTTPYFGVVGIKAFRWTWEQGALEYAKRTYLGFKVELTVRLF